MSTKIYRRAASYNGALTQDVDAEHYWTPCYSKVNKNVLTPLVTINVPGGATDIRIGFDGDDLDLLRQAIAEYDKDHSEKPLSEYTVAELAAEIQKRSNE